MSKEDVQINVSVTFRKTESTSALKKYATEKVTSRIKKYVISDSEVHIILSVKKQDHIAEVRFTSAQRYDVSVKAVTEDLYSAIDKVVDNLVAQMRKQKEKLLSHKS